MSQSRKLYSCNKCQWVHFGVSRTEGGDTSKNCFRCGNPHTDFSPSDGSGCPTGSTIQGILSEEGHGDIPASGQESGKTPLEIISKQLAPMLVPGSFQSTKQTPRQDTTPKTKSTTWLVDAELDLSKGPLLFLALNSINGGMSPNPKWPRLWVRTRHQAGGLSCNSEELMGTVLQPLPAVAEKVRELARRWDGSNAGAMGDSLKEVTGYAADLKELLGASCDSSFKKFQEAVYPIDLDDSTRVEDFTGDNLPDRLDDLFVYASPYANMFGWVGRWRLYILSENSD